MTMERYKAEVEVEIKEGGKRAGFPDHVTAEILDTLVDYIAYGTSGWSEFDLFFKWDAINLEYIDSKMFVTLTNLECECEDGDSTPAKDFTFALHEHDDRTAVSVYNDEQKIKRTTFIPRELFLDFYI